MAESAGDDQAAADEADHRQADYFRSELSRQARLLSEQSQKVRAALEDAKRRGDRLHAHHIQNALSETSIEQAKVLQMLTALERRFNRSSQ
jgi:phage terminase Nu1 subunit (DNA packaging protein)